MAKIKLTQKAVDRLRAPDKSGRQQLYWDSELKGFGLLVSGTTTTKSYVVQRDLKGGKTRRVTIAPVNVLTCAEARVRAEGVLSEFYGGKDPKVTQRAAATLRATLDAYLAARPALRGSSRAEYRSMVERHLRSWLNLPLSQITAEMVEKRHRSIAAEIGAADFRPGAARANAVMRVLRALFNYGAQHNPDLSRNPVRLKNAWFPVPRRERLVKAEELPAFYAAVCALPNPIARDYLLLLLFSGLRRREAASLRWEDVDLTARIIRVPAVSTKAGRKLDLPMTDFVHDLLVARRALGKTKFIFESNSRSGYIEEPKFPLGQVALATGIKVSAHDLRRVYLTTAESCDISPLALKALVNHSLGNSDVTSGYVMITVERLREPAQKVTDSLKILCGIGDVAAGNVARLNG